MQPINPTLKDAFYGHSHILLVSKIRRVKEDKLARANKKIRVDFLLL